MALPAPKRCAAVENGCHARILERFYIADGTKVAQVTVVVGNEVVAQEHFRKGLFDVGLIETSGNESVKNLGVRHGAVRAEQRMHKVVCRHELLICLKEFRA